VLRHGDGRDRVELEEPSLRTVSRTPSAERPFGPRAGVPNLRNSRDSSGIATMIEGLVGSWTNRVVHGIAILGLAAAPAVALLAPVPGELVDSAFGSEWMARTVLGLATLAVASLVNFYVGYLVLEGALPARIQSLGQAVDLASSAAGDLREASEAVARTEKGLSETADQMRTQVTDASEKIRALETRITELQRARVTRRRWRWGL
jgi:hypothetical protein